MKILFLIIVSSVLATIILAACPMNYLINPCHCSDGRITCDGEYSYNLKNIFTKLNRTLRHEVDRTFEEFVLNNTDISELVDDVFGMIRFRKIRLVDALSLRRISGNAFAKNGDLVEQFVASGESLLGEDAHSNDLFDAFNQLTNCKRIWLNRNRLRSIPTVAFGKRANSNFQLEELNFNKFSSKNGNIRSVGNFAFYYLNQLTYLYLSHQRINYLPSNAFDFERPSNRTLYIYLGNNKLNNTSFEKGIFLNTKRPVHLELYWNPDLTYLDEKVFAPFLDQNKQNKISLQDNPLTCDCNSYWMVRDKEKYQDQLSNVMCKIGPKQSFSIDLIPFDKCANNGKKRNKGKLTIVN
ncbi:hypothetical protein RDWZM_009137 [Blomia tropicalis]|uniref:Uncharacterized protein n=1 Tax=Blomia tropicalis TaxID=40697 RepID=A0A9Q0M2K1_BLOTA|nr:hypothetical protein RDWZM_009137 [Blomia tropicalis]